MLRRQIIRLRCLSPRHYVKSGGDTPDTKGLYEKGKAQENIYIRKKEYEDLLRLKRRMQMVEEQQAELQEQLDKAVDILDELKKAKENLKK